MDVFASSHLRANIIAWLPIKKTDTVCYIGGEADVVAEKLRELSGCVDCVPDAFGVGTKYDYIISLGAAKREEILHYYDGLKETGKLILAAENAYGLKYLAGTKEIGAGTYFASIEAREHSLGHTKEELEDALAKAGFAWRQFYYPFPDYFFAMSIYSDDYLPRQGELTDQIGNFDAERLVLFDEAKAADALIARGKFVDFSNSYLIAAGKKDAGRIENDDKESIAFVKFSNDRGKGHNIVTQITKSDDGQFHLLKMADGTEAMGQIESIKKTYRVLKELYADAGFCINRCLDRKGCAELEFLSGHTMEEELDALLERGEYAQASKQLCGVLEEITNCKPVTEFQMTREFQKVFGEPLLPQGLAAAVCSDIDMIMSNILVGEDGNRTIIDYEWSFHFPVPLNFILYRAIRYYADTTETRRKLNPESLYEKVKITEMELAAYAEMEEAFQKYVLDGHVPMRQLYKTSGRPAYHITSVLHVVDELERRRALQIYFDKGMGFCEEHTATYRSKALDGTYRLEIPVGEEVRQLRIDPGSQACTVKISRLSWKDGKDTILDFVSNGHKMDGSTYLFDTEDPNILLTQLPAGEKTLLLDLRIDSVSLAAAEWIAPKIDAKYRLKKILKK